MNPLARDFSFPELLRFALPTTVVMFFMGLYTIADTIFVARYVGEHALSAINIACPVINLMVGIAAMLATGGSALIARKMGSGDEDRARRDFTLIIVAGGILGAAIGLVGVLGIDPIIRALGASEVLFPYCRRYLGVLFLFAPACMLQVLFQTLVVTAGRPRIGMALAFASGSLNIGLDLLFMGRLGMGIVGAALGTGIGYLLPTLVGFAFFTLHRGPLRFKRPLLDPTVLGESLANGSSEMIGQLSAAITTFFFNVRMMRLLGETGVAAITILVFSQFLLSSFHFGFSMGVAPIISYKHGNGNLSRLGRIIRDCLLFVAGLSFCIWILATLSWSSLVGLFTARDTALHELAGRGFRVFALSFLFSGINIFASAAFTALSDGKTSAIISFLRTFGFLALFQLALPALLGVDGIWLAVPASELSTFIVSLAFLRRLRWRVRSSSA